MQVTIGRKFPIRQYEIHEITLVLNDKEDIPDFSGSLIERALELRRIATRLIRAEMFTYGVLPEKEILDKWDKRELSAREQLTRGESKNS